MRKVDRKLIFLGVILLIFGLFLFFRFYREKRKEKEKYWMCDWDCTKEDRLLLYTEIVDETQVCDKKKTISWEGAKLKCKLLGSFLRTKKEIENMCKEDYIICE